MANDTKTDAEYQKGKANADAKFADALKYMLRAHELNEKDKFTVNILKQIYLRMNNTEKYKEFDEKLKNM